MIDAVVLKLNPEMMQALTDAPSDWPIRDALESVQDIPGEPDCFYLHVEPEMAQDWVESWFDPEDLEGAVTAGHTIDVEYPEICEDELIKDFVDTVLKIYRLTVSV